MYKYLEKENDISFHKIFNQVLGKHGYYQTPTQSNPISTTFSRKLQKIKLKKQN